jgi:uncharacterized protein YaaR (DUF327 family)
MEKIEANAPFFNPVAYSGLKPDPKKTKSKDKIKDKPLFSHFLQDVRDIEETRAADDARPVNDETIKELLDDVHSAGDALKNRPLPEEILQYKRAVRNFLDFIVRNTYNLEKQYTGSPRKRREKTIIQIVDQKLDKLAAGILAGQYAQLEILERLEEITGILVDLLS